MPKTSVEDRRKEYLALVAKAANGQLYRPADLDRYMELRKEFGKTRPKV